MKKVIFLIVIIITLVLIFFVVKNPLEKPEIASTTPKNTIYHLSIGSDIFEVEIADTPQKREVGLSEKESMNQNQGMLFVFEKSYLPLFWMKNMKFPLDFIWIKDNRIVQISENIPVLTDGIASTIAPTTKIDSVLEINAGMTKKYNIAIGDKISITTHDKE